VSGAAALPVEWAVGVAHDLVTECRLTPPLDRGYGAGLVAPDVTLVPVGAAKR